MKCWACWYGYLKRELGDFAPCMRKHDEDCMYYNKETGKIELPEEKR